MDALLESDRSTHQSARSYCRVLCNTCDDTAFDPPSPPTPSPSRAPASAAPSAAPTGPVNRPDCAGVQDPDSLCGEYGPESCYAFVDLPPVCPALCGNCPPTSAPQPAPTVAPTAEACAADEDGVDCRRTIANFAGAGCDDLEIALMCRRSCCPTAAPTRSPTTLRPTGAPTDQPTARPTTLSPTPAPTTLSPTPGPTTRPTRRPTPGPTVSPTPRPSAAPTAVPTGHPASSTPTWAPTARPTGAPTVERCAHKFDLVFLMDESSSITQPALGGMASNWQDALDFVSNVTEYFKVGTDPATGELSTRVGVVTFSGPAQGSAENARVRIGLDDHSDRAGLRAAISGIPHLGGATYTDAGLRRVLTDIVPTFRPLHAQVFRVVVLVTDGRSTTGHDYTAEWRELQDDHSVTMVVRGPPTRGPPCMHAGRCR